MNEVNHRAKNLLTVVQVIARQTARDRVAEEFTDLLNKRIGALAAGHDLLVQTSWQGVDFLELVRAQLAYHKDLIGTQILADGLGHTVIVRMVASALDGQVRLEYPESGVIWDVVAPVSRIVESGIDEPLAADR